MEPFYIMIEGVFITSPELGIEKGGFHTTFYLAANNGQNAVKRVGELLYDRMKRHQVEGFSDGFFRTYFSVYSCREATAEELLKNGRLDLGFSFFRIGGLEKFSLALRRLFIQRHRPWSLVEPKKSEAFHLGKV